MARRKATLKNNPKSKLMGKTRKKKGSGLGRFLRFLVSTPVRQLLLLAIIVALLFWQWPNIKAVAARLVELFGWGLVLMAVAVGTLSIRLWQRKLASFIYHGNRWLGSIAFMLAIWGILGFFNLGGSFGLSIIRYDIVDYPLSFSILRVLGLVVIGVILIAPRVCFRLVAKFISWLGKQFQRQPAPRPPQKELQPPIYPVTHTRPAITEQPVMPPERVIPKSPLLAPEKEVATSGLAPTQAQQELRQVAQEVWKKYGQSPESVTVDGWRLPPIDILDRTPEVEFSQADNMQRAKSIEEALASYGVEAKVVQINAGPTITQFGVEPGWDRKFKEIKEKDRDGNVEVRLKEVSKTRVKVERITSLANDLALALAAPSIRIEAPVPGERVVGIEVPNTISGLVSLRGVMETTTFQKIASRSKLSLALGKGAGGEAVSADLSRMPHLLIAGATGSGKTVCLNAIIICLLLRNTPNDVQFIMIDPKRVELTPYNSIPHLAAPVIVDTNKAVSVLRWLNQQMDQRYQKLATAGARNIEGYNKNKQGEEKLSYMILIIDELADLMMAGFDEVEHILCRLAQLARATGIHLVVATQRPSVDVVTGLIKANFPTRISFAVTSQVDSRTILDSGGAEKLLGRGDMLYMPTEAAKPKRLQGCLVSDAEVERLVYFWNSQQKKEEAQLKIEELVSSPASARKGGYPEDSLMAAARQLAREHEHISASYLQRKLRIGYPRAARIMEQLEGEGAKEKGEGEG